MKITSKISIPLSCFFENGNPDLELIGVKPNYIYADGKRTDNINGTQYFVGSATLYEKFTIKVLNQPAIIKQEEIDASKEPIQVVAKECFGKPYRSNTGDYELSFTAAAITKVK